MEISDRLKCLFSATIEQRDESYVIEIPSEELELGTLKERNTYQVAVLSSQSNSSSNEEAESLQKQTDNSTQPPVEEGETRTVTIEGLGDQGDGIARVERGFIVIVPDTEKGEKVRISITDVQQSVAFAEVVERISFYD